MRFVIVTFSLLLLTVSALTVAAWVRSYWVIDEWSMANDDGEVVAVLSFRGAIHHTRSGTSAAPRRWSYDEHRVPDGATWAHLYTMPGHVAWRRFGFVRIQRRPAGAGPVTPFGTPAGATASGAAATAPVAYVGRQSVTPWLIFASYDAWIVPYWALAAATGFVPATWLPWFARRFLRRKRGLCIRCGYDLRASSDRCPECGAAVVGKRRSADPVMSASSAERST